MERDKMFDSYELALRLEKARNSTGKTQQEVADDLGINRNQVKVWECGTREIKAKDLFTLSKYYGVSVDYLLGLTDAATTNTDLRTVCDYTGLSDYSIKALRLFDKDDEFVEGDSNMARAVSPKVINLLIEHEKDCSLFTNIAQFITSYPNNRSYIVDAHGNIEDPEKDPRIGVKLTLADKDRPEGFLYYFGGAGIIERVMLDEIESALKKAREIYRNENSSD